jgi:hypothetical protein
MQIKWLAGLALIAVLASACASPASNPASTSAAASRSAALDAPGPSASEPTPADTPDRIFINGFRKAFPRGTLEDYLRILSSSSCPAGTPPSVGEPTSITVRSSAMIPSSPSSKRIGDLTFVAGFSLTSEDPRFGGLSDLHLLDNGNLVAVSDGGAFVWMDLAPDGVTPLSARISPLLDMNGEPLKAIQGDAQGLAINGGVALVSFGHNHRVLAYDLGKCGAAARGAPIVFGPYGLPLADAFGDAGLAVTDRTGVEALAVTPNWYLFTGVGAKVGKLSALSARPIEGDLDFSLRVGVEQPELAGMDVVSPWLGDPRRAQAFLLHRSRDPRQGVSISETLLELFQSPGSGGGEFEARSRNTFVEVGWRLLAKLDPPVASENFEGVTAKELTDGRVRLFLISDNNFADKKSTLLWVFDVPKPLR